MSASKKDAIEAKLTSLATDLGRDVFFKPKLKKEIINNQETSQPGDQSTSQPVNRSTENIDVNNIKEKPIDQETRRPVNQETRNTAKDYGIRRSEGSEGSVITTRVGFYCEPLHWIAFDLWARAEDKDKSQKLRELIKDNIPSEFIEIASMMKKYTSIEKTKNPEDE